jgi:hypothetical protein
MVSLTEKESLSASQTEISMNYGLSNVTAVATLLKWLPFDAVQKAIFDEGAETIRMRALPMELMMYVCVAWGLNRGDSLIETVDKVLSGAEFIFGKKVGQTPSGSAAVQARQKLGEKPLQSVFEACCKPLATVGTPGAFYKNWLLTALDGCLMNAADTRENRKEFDSAKNQNATESAYPQIRMVCLGECGTHAIVEAEFGGYRDGEFALAKKVLPKLTPNMLCLADRFYFGYELWDLANATGAALLWRLRSNTKLFPQSLLPDGSYIAELRPSGRNEHNKHSAPILVRVVEYERRTAKPKQSERVRLATNILDPTEAPADELAQLYCQRWEIELVYGELKTRLNANQVALKSASPAMVRQELWSLLLAHYCVRAVMYEAATASRKILDPDEISFIGTVNVIRREMLNSGDFSP